MPDGFFMVQQWANLLDKSHSHIRRMVLDAVKSRKMETKDFRVKVGRSIRKEAHYRLIGSR